MTPTLYLARHAETVFNAAARMQGHMGHTPLTRNGIRQAEDMGRALRDILGPKPDIDLWASRSGRTMQTAAIIAEHLERDFFDIRPDDRLLEIDVGDWERRSYQDIVAESGPTVCPDRRVFLEHPRVLDGHGPAVEIHHPRLELEMGVVERGLVRSRTHEWPQV